MQQCNSYEVVAIINFCLDLSIKLKSYWNGPLAMYLNSWKRVEANMMSKCAVVVILWLLPSSYTSSIPAHWGTLFHFIKWLYHVVGIFVWYNVSNAASWYNELNNANFFHVKNDCVRLTNMYNSENKSKRCIDVWYALLNDWGCLGICDASQILGTLSTIVWSWP